MFKPGQTLAPPRMACENAPAITDHHFRISSFCFELVETISCISSSLRLICLPAALTHAIRSRTTSFSFASWSHYLTTTNYSPTTSISTPPRQSITAKPTTTSSLLDTTTSWALSSLVKATLLPPSGEYRRNGCE